MIVRVLTILVGLALVGSLAAARTPVVREIDLPPIVDGDLGDDVWDEVGVQELVMNGFHVTEETRNLTFLALHDRTTLYLAFTVETRGADPLDHLVVNIDPENDREASDGGEDFIRFGFGEEPTWFDGHWNATHLEWFTDEVAGCATDGEGARRLVGDVWHYEIAKPLSGDACDMQIAPGATVALRFEVWENLAPKLGGEGDFFRWPQGSVDHDGARPFEDDGDLSEEMALWSAFGLQDRAALGNTSADNGDDSDRGMPGPSSAALFGAFAFLAIVGGFTRRASCAK